MEDDLYNFISSIYDGNIIRGNRRLIKGTSQEVDMYLPDKQIAIEFNGDYWHSSLLKDKNYHKNKTLACAKNGTRLIHIFEYEWEVIETKDKIKDYLRDVICSHIPIYARECEVSEITTEEATIFCEKNHLQGYSKSSIKIGLKHDKGLVSVMTFSAPRFTADKCNYELIRLCTKHGYTVVGGAQKMFKYFINKYNPSEVLTYCDISKFTGNIYTRLGFKVDRFTDPNYKWVFNGSHIRVLSRYQTQKQKLIEQGLGTLDQTEDEIMENLGYIKIYDSGNLRLLWERS